MLDKNGLEKGAAGSFNKQNVSACVDNELEAFATESSFALESEEMQLWSRYHLIGQVMRDEAQHLDIDISGRINEQIADEPAHTMNPAKPKSNVIRFPTKPFKQLTGYAIAASVALVVLFNVGTQSQFDSPVTPLATVASTDTATSSSNTANLSRVERQELQTIHDMFLKHEALSQSSLLPSVQVVSNQKVIPVSVPMLAEQTPQESSLQALPVPMKSESEQEGVQ
ncbi:sigma-E factor negative regulatory protein [Kangiella sp. M94]